MSSEAPKPEAQSSLPQEAKQDVKQEALATRGAEIPEPFSIDIKEFVGRGATREELFSFSESLSAHATKTCEGLCKQTLSESQRMAAEIGKN